MFVAAFDLALTRTGWAIGKFREHSAVTDVGHLDGRSRGTQRLDQIERDLRPVWRGADLVVLEGYAFSKGASGHAHGIGELGGIMRLAWWRSGVPFVEVNPSALKKYATGKGNAPKESVLAAAIRRLDYGGDDHNDADALWLLTMALDHYGLETARVPEAHRAGLVAVQWPTIRSEP